VWFPSIDKRQGSSLFRCRPLRPASLQGAGGFSEISLIASIRLWGSIYRLPASVLMLGAARSLFFPPPPSHCLFCSILSTFPFPLSPRGRFALFPPFPSRGDAWSASFVSQDLSCSLFFAICDIASFLSHILERSVAPSYLVPCDTPLFCSAQLILPVPRIFFKIDVGDS